MVDNSVNYSIYEHKTKIIDEKTDSIVLAGANCCVWYLLCSDGGGNYRLAVDRHSLATWCCSYTGGADDVWSCYVYQN